MALLHSHWQREHLQVTNPLIGKEDILGVGGTGVYSKGALNIVSSSLWV